MSRHSFSRDQRGFSLVELMVGMVLSLVLLAGALSILYTSKVTYAENDRIARLQEAGRTVVELILRDARAAGYQGCGRPTGGSSTYANALANPTNLLWNMGQAIYGYDGWAGAWNPALDVANIPNAVANSDVIVLRTTREGTPTFELNGPVTNETDDIPVNRAAGVTVDPRQTMVINDCRGTSAFAVSAFVPDTATTAHIQHGTIGGAGADNATTGLLRGFTADARVSFVDTVIYYVRDDNDGTGPALWRRVGSAAPQKLIPGVENLQIQYGVDTDGDLRANEYDTADVVDAAGNWANVISLTIAVLVRSPDETNLETDTRQYTMLERTLPPAGTFNDRRQRSLFITTVTLRNQTT